MWTVQDDPPLPEDDENKEKRTDDISSWDADFLKVPYYLKVHKRENFLGSDIEICTFS
jgi:hypothetical protein